MRLKLIFALIVFVTGNAFAGTYVYEHPVEMIGYGPSDCKSEGYQWSDEQGCLRPDSKDVITDLLTGRSHTITVETIGNNGAACSFKSQIGHFEAPDALTATNDAYIIKEDQQIRTPCQITVTFNRDAEKSVTVTTVTEEACRYFCGTGVSLNILKALPR